MTKRQLLGCLGVLAGLSLLAWRFSATNGLPLRGTGRALATLTRPPSGEALEARDLERVGEGAQSTWEFRTEMDWDSYRKWVRNRLEHFEPTAGSEHSAAFARWQGGDSYLLSLEMVSAGPPVRIRAVLRVAPD